MTMPGTMPTPAEPQDHLATLLQLGQLLNSSLDLHHVLETAIDQVIAFVGAERGFILLVDIETSKFVGEAVRNIDREALEATLTNRDQSNRAELMGRAEISRTIVENVLTNRQPVVSVNAMDDPRFASAVSVQFSNLRSVLCVPLVAQGRLLGIIYLDNRIRTALFTEHHLSMLLAFANQAAVAIENARLYANLRRSLEERLQLQDALHRQETQRLAVEEASRLKSDFIGFVAHELRNPLTTIRGYVQTLMQDTDNTLGAEVQAEFYEAIEADSDRLLDLINELLDLSRLEAGRPLAVACSEFELRPLLDKLVRRHRFSKFFTNKHRLELEIAPDLPVTIEADEDKLNQIFSNLLSNAIKYSPNGGQVTVLAKRDGEDHVIIDVKDEGLGLTEEQAARLFRQYERAERDDIRNIPGTGLGLFLVKHLVELHGGTITCTSEPGQGSTFSVRLPIRKTHAVVL